MSGSRLPAPLYIADQVQGTIIGSTLYVDREPSVDIAADVNIPRGDFIIRYAIPVLVPPGISMIPGLFVSERGEMLTGREGWDYLQKRFQLHPRADVIGVQSDGTSLQLVVKALDFGAPVQVYVYRDTTIAEPIAMIESIDVSDKVFSTLPELLRHHTMRVDGR